MAYTIPLAQGRIVPGTTSRTDLLPNRILRAPLEIGLRLPCAILLSGQEIMTADPCCTRCPCAFSHRGLEVWGDTRQGFCSGRGRGQGSQGARPSLERRDEESPPADDLILHASSSFLVTPTPLTTLTSLLAESGTYQRVLSLRHGLSTYVSAMGLR